MAWALRAGVFSVVTTPSLPSWERRLGHLREQKEDHVARLWQSLPMTLPVAMEDGWQRRKSEIFISVLTPPQPAVQLGPLLLRL